MKDETLEEFGSFPKAYSQGLNAFNLECRENQRDNRKSNSEIKLVQCLTLPVRVVPQPHSPLPDASSG